MKDILLEAAHREKVFVCFRTRQPRPWLVGTEARDHPKAQTGKEEEIV